MKIEPMESKFYKKTKNSSEIIGWFLPLYNKINEIIDVINSKEPEKEVLKDCPCCGYEAKVTYSFNEKNNIRINCTNDECHLSTEEKYDIKDAIKIWNKRS